MSDYYDAFEISPVPVPVPGAVAPEPFRGIYGMPSFVTIPTADLAASVDFWTRGLGFFALFTIPGRLVHLRRWAFQDVLLVPAESRPGPPPTGLSIGFACVLDQIEGIADACRAIRPDAVGVPTDTPWGTRDLEIVTPEDVRIVLTAAMPFDPTSPVARNLEAIGIVPPGPADVEDGPRAR